MKKFFTVCLCVLGFLGFSSVYAATQLNSSNCGLQELPLQTPSIKKSACNTKFALAPRAAQTIWGAALVLPGSPTLPAGSYAAINGGFNAWNVTDVNTRGRLTGWNGSFTDSDCPNGRPFQVGMLNFSILSDGGSCLTVIANGLFSSSEDSIYIPLAFVDYDSSVCAGCGTKSLTINLAVAWSTAAAPPDGHRDLQSVMAHEFGHVLGMGHHMTLNNASCGNYFFNAAFGVEVSPTCAATINPATGLSIKSTMENINYTGSTENCGRTLEAFDKMRANQIYSAAEICQ